MKHIVFLNEFNVFGVLLSKIKKQDVYLFQIDPIIPVSKPCLEFAADRLLRAGWIKDISLLDVNAAALRARMPLFPRKGWYARVEKFFVDQLRLDQQKAPDERYDFAACKQAINFGADQLMVIHFIHELNEKSPNLRLALHGCASIMRDIHVSLGVHPDRIDFFPTRYPHRLINAGLTSLAIFRTLSNIIRFTKLNPSPRRKILLAIDVIDNLDRMVPLVNDILDDVGRQGLYVFRNRKSFEVLKDGLRSYPLSPYPDGQFSYREFLTVCARVISDAAKLFGRFSFLESRLFLQIVKLCAARIYFRGLLNKYDIANFLGRDEYNAEHIIRSQELRRRGAVSLGLLNGLNLFGIDSVFRYCDYDITYVFSTGPYLRYNRDNWRHPEGVRQIGAVTMSRDSVHEMLAVAKSRNIVCFAKNYCDGPEYLDEIFKLAAAFPDRDILISLKKSSIRIGGYDDFVAYLNNAPSNVRMVDDDTFDLIKHNRYVISGESSIVTEAIHLGCFTFFLDTYPLEETFVYRDYDELCHRNGTAIIERIEGIERGTWQYPVNNYADLADLSGVLAADTIRRTIGLPPKDPPLLMAYWNAAA